MDYRFMLIHSTLRASACSALHFNAHLKFAVKIHSICKKGKNNGCCVDVFDSMKIGSVLYRSF